MATVTISDKGQVTLPAGIRKKLGLGPRRKMEVTECNGRIVMEPVKSILDLYGVFHEQAQGKTGDWETVRNQVEAAVAEEVVNEDIS